jgi:hypothetical protein
MQIFYRVKRTNLLSWRKKFIINRAKYCELKACFASSRYVKHKISKGNLGSLNADTYLGIKRKKYAVRALISPEKSQLFWILNSKLLTGLGFHAA